MEIKLIVKWEFLVRAASTTVQFYNWTAKNSQWIKS